MQPKMDFLDQPKNFWANVRLISQEVGYSDRQTGGILVPSISDAQSALNKVGLTSDHLVKDGRVTTLGQDIVDYFAYRSQVLTEQAEPNLMDKDRAQSVFEDHLDRLEPSAPIPMNKQKGDKRGPAYFTGLINMLIEANIEGRPCDYDPRELTTVTKDGAPLRTLSRWVDGAFPTAVDPIAIWEIKEYYHTTTFGSRVADGVYESLLDGMELKELHEHENVKVRHYFMVDSHYTWWKSGKSYLCRMIDMIHMGYVDEVLFGYEVVEAIPRLTAEWLAVEDGRHN